MRRGEWAVWSVYEGRGGGNGQLIVKERPEAEPQLFTSTSGSLGEAVKGPRAPGG